ncbi:MAG TPA: ABC transporter substrate-binding protein [Solirubrobacteraceae bacterium]|nr:ABC transporter substrate-binding protein [Solirubrobacteraceae bacterium]
MTRALSAGAVLVAALVAAGCSQSNGAARAAHGGTLVFARAADIRSLDPTAVLDNPSIWAQEQIYETLYTATADGRGMRPWLATRYTVSPDKRTWTFDLRPGVRFSNGRPLRAADVAYSIDRARRSTNGFGYIDAAIASVSAPDDRTVVVRTRYAWAPLLADLSLFVNGVVPRNLGGQSPAEFFRHPVGTGPFVVTAWQRARYLLLRRNRYYWQPGKPYLDQVEFSVVPDDSTRLARVTSGDAQIVELQPADGDALSHVPVAAAVAFPSTRIDVLLPNERYKPLADVHVRRAIGLAIDRAAIVDAVLAGQGRPANSTFPENVPFYNPRNPGLTFNPKRAGQELAHSAYPHGFKLEFLTSSDPNYTEVARGVQQELAALGITVTIRTVAPTALFALQQKFDYQLSIDVWTMDIPDPDEYAAYSLSPTGGVHAFYTGFHDPRMTALVERAQTTFSPVKRAALYAQIQTLADADVPQIPLYYSPLVYGVARKLHGFRVYPLGNYPLADVHY